MPPAVLVDTMIASAWLGRRDSPRKTRWQPLLEQAAWVLPFTVVAEMRFGAEVAGWGSRRRGVLDRLIARTGVMPPLNEVTDAYVDLRSWAVRTGHGLGAKDHEADRWVAAVAIVDLTGNIPPRDAPNHRSSWRQPPRTDGRRTRRPSGSLGSPA